MNETRAPRWANPVVLLGLAMVAAAALTYRDTAGSNVYADELQILSSYHSWDPGVLLQAAGGHLILTSLLVYKGIFELFGADSYVPNRIVHVVLSLLSTALFFQLTRRRVGDWVALAPTLVLLFLGSAGEFTATPFGVLGYMGVAFGLAMFLALEREDRTGDIWACVFLAGGLASYSINVAFGIGAAVWIWMRGPRRRERGPSAPDSGARGAAVNVGRWRSAWVILIPAAIYFLWRVTHFDPGETNISVGNLAEIPAAMYTSLAAGIAAITGLFRVPGSQGAVITPEWGYPLGAVFIGLLLWRLHRPPQLDRRFWVWLASLLSFWALVALNLGPLREPEATRYTYISALLMLLMMVEMVAGLEWPRWARPALAGAVAVSLLANVIALHQSALTFRIAGQSLSAQLAAAELARDDADPNAPVLALQPLPVQRDLIIPIHDYLSAIDDVGSPAYTPSELEHSSEASRAQADVQLVRLEGVGVTPVATLPPGCKALQPAAGPTGILNFQMPPGGIVLHAAPGPPVAVAVRRFARSITAPLRGVAGGATAQIAIPPDRSSHPWTAVLAARQPVQVCAKGPG